MEKDKPHLVPLSKQAVAIYNKAEYLVQRRKMLQWWADLVDAQIEEGRKVVIGRFREGGSGGVKA